MIGVKSLPRGDQHWTRVHPERVKRGAEHPMHLRPEIRPWGERNGAYTHPERIRRGEENGMAKLTEKEILEIRHAYQHRYFTMRELAAIFSVSRPLIGYVVKRQIWTHVA